MKKVWALILIGFIALTVTAADKLPGYDTPEWHALPGMKEVRAAAEKGDVDAQYLLAIAIQEGKNSLDQHMETLDMEWVLKAKAQGVSIFESPVAGRDEEKVLSAFRDFAEKGFYVAQRAMGEMRLKQNRSEAIEWWRKAASQGDSVSQYNLGKSYWDGDLGKADPEMTLKLWELSAAQGNDWALKDLGVFWKDGFNGKRNIAMAIKYFELAVEKGNTPAAYILGEIYSEGRYGIPVDHELAGKYFRKAAEREKNVEIQIERTAELHFQYAQSYQKKNNLAERDKLLKSAAKLGHKIAPIVIICNKFFEGNEKEKTDAVKELTALAEKGNSSAQFDLAMMLFSLGREEEGKIWYCRALGNGEFKAFTMAPHKLSEIADTITDKHRKYLRGVLLSADYLDNSDMQYLALILLRSNIFPEDTERVTKYGQKLLEKQYPRILYPVLCLDLKENANKISAAEQADLALQIEKLADYLRDLAARGDNDAAGLLNEYSATPEPEKSENNSNAGDSEVDNN